MMFTSVLKALGEGQGEQAWELAVQEIASLPGVRSAAIVRSLPPDWSIAAQVGQVPPVELAAEAMDQSKLIDQGDWTAAPLSSIQAALLLQPAIDHDDLQSLAVELSAVLRVAIDQHQLRREAKRLRTLLTLVNQWRQNDDLKELLHQMAASACQLFHADRASIFLWDRPTKTLVGRPAIGIEAGELRIPDDAGVVGTTLARGEPMRVSPGKDADAIDRTTDAKTGYQTKSLLAAPLITPGGAKLGVFELINKLAADEFSVEDQHGLVDFAQFASAALDANQQYQRLLDQHERTVDSQAQQVRLIGECDAVVSLRQAIERVADTDLSVLILGENGTGKEVVAQALHYGSRRRSAPFVAVNCAAIAETLLESELFGHERGAFTDARETRQGKFELASGGTLLLDEIGDMSLAGQAKLLRALEQKEVVRVGGSMAIATDVRVLAATNQDLPALVREKKFREDLYFRLNVAALETPPLRQRGEDILLLADHFLQHFCTLAGRKMPQFLAESKKRLLAHRWPGNVRELRNMMERLAYLTAEDRIAPSELQFTDSPEGGRDALLDLGLPLAEATEEFQRQYITSVIDSLGGNVTQAAQHLGVFRSNLYRKMKSLDLQAEGDT